VTGEVEASYDPAMPSPGNAEPGRLPDFLILGAPKSGTTSLAAWLGAHPDVFVPPQKELHFFCRDDRWEQGLPWYEAQFDGAGRRRLAGEATPNYLDDVPSAARIAATVPSARMIAILRDPVARAWSHHCYDRDLDIHTTAFEQVAASAGTDHEHRYLWQGRYVRHLERYAALVDREQLLVLWFDDLRDRPDDTWREVCAFLRLDPDPVPAAVGSVHNRHYTVRVPAVRRAMVRYRAWKRLPFGLAGRVDGWLRDEQPYEELDPGTRDELRATFADDDRALEAWLGRPRPPDWSG
jgi:hypothetical protein